MPWRTEGRAQQRDWAGRHALLAERGVDGSLVRIELAGGGRVVERREIEVIDRVIADRMPLRDGGGEHLLQTARLATRVGEARAETGRALELPGRDEEGGEDALLL